MSFFFNDTATTEIYTLSLHDALPICSVSLMAILTLAVGMWGRVYQLGFPPTRIWDEIYFPVMARGYLRGEYVFDLHRSEEHTSELQSRQYLVCRLLLEKKQTHIHTHV